MASRRRSSLLFALTLFGGVSIFVGASAYGQQPTDAVTSDACDDTAMGKNALLNNSKITPPGCGFPGPGNNTAVGFEALYKNTIGSDNTAVGAHALLSNISGYDNTATGVWALSENTTGYQNTAVGNYALNANVVGHYNTALGNQTLQGNTSGDNNTATGAIALYNNQTGGHNTASGYYALFFNSTGSYNTGSGDSVLFSNTNGKYNVAVGSYALYSNTTGIENTVSGTAALYANTTGGQNTAIGYKAGYYVTTGSNNIEVGNTGASTDNGTIRIGTQGSQKSTYIAGIVGHALTGAAVYVTSAGELGVLASSERYKADVTSMGTTTRKLDKLRPVTYHLKTDPKAQTQYGLIAEEVAKVYPELVIRGDKGQIEGVRYEELTPMLLNEIQQQQRRLAEEHGRLVEQQAELQDMRSQLGDLRRAVEDRTH